MMPQRLIPSGLMEKMGHGKPGEVEIGPHLNCSHCLLKECQWQVEIQLAECMCLESMALAADNITCRGMVESMPSRLPTSVNHQKRQGLCGMTLPGPELELSKLQTPTILTAPNPHYCQAAWPCPALPCLQGSLRFPTDNVPLLSSAVRTSCAVWGPASGLPLLNAAGIDIWRRQEEFPEAQPPAPGGRTCLSSQSPLKTSCSRWPRTEPGCSYLEENHFIHRSEVMLGHCCPELPAGCTEPSRVANTGDMGMARGRYRCGDCAGGEGSALRESVCTLVVFEYLITPLLSPVGPVITGGPGLAACQVDATEAFLEGAFTSKALLVVTCLAPALLWLIHVRGESVPDRLHMVLLTRDAGLWGALWEIFSLGCPPCPGHTSVEVLDVVIRGADGPPGGCPGPVPCPDLCWQHQPELRPSFASPLERLQCCTQDPDVLDSPLPMGPGPPRGEQGTSGQRNRSLAGLTWSQAQELSLESLKSQRGSLLGPWLPSGHDPSKSRERQAQKLWLPPVAPGV
ncbi:Leukocyte tyrosine kinase receptor [Galemys pyrenaicus]|uniref:Leukocyte tyrosine kinase receptor n=1 Tax=Galemys pyrenaicus TaxID=202257 RepID=A0A8J6A5J3_GALPY|nr:Leukocyte tyrosine kinase receptor [Galemys pyrenaicus]